MQVLGQVVPPKKKAPVTAKSIVLGPQFMHELVKCNFPVHFPVTIIRSAT